LLEEIRRVVQEVNTAENLQQTLALIVLRVKEVMATDVCSVYLKDELAQQNVLMATDGLDPASVGNARLKLGKGLTGLVMERAEPINLKNAMDHPAYHFIKETGEESYHGFLGIPIIHHKTALGVIVVQTAQERNFAEDEVTLLVTLAAQLSGAIAHAQAIGDIKGLKNNVLLGNRPFRGLAGASGVTIGTALVIYPPADLDAVPNRSTTDTANEIKTFESAVAKVRQEIAELKTRVKDLSSENIALFDAYLLMLESNSLLRATKTRIEKNKCWASTALRDTIKEQVQVFDAMQDDYLRERAQDIKDLGRRILVHIQSKKSGTRRYPDKTILVSDELSASSLMEIPRSKLAGVICTHGSGSSHVAILARALGIPAVMGALDLPTNQVDSAKMIVDGYQGYVYVNPEQTVEIEYLKIIKEEEELSAELLESTHLPTETLDNVHIPLLVNTGLLADIASSSADSGAEGIGLYRTEFPFMIRDRFPGEEEQTKIYRKVLQSFAPRPVILRTLDIGGDKNLSYFPIKEENPFLGWRGIRISLDHPEIFLTQVRAMLRASIGLDNLHILLPMITSTCEVIESIAYINRAQKELIESGHAIPMPKIGAMIEVPSAVYQVDSIAKHADFLSIGTNDLIQYLLAVDRNNPNVANLFDSFHPAILHAIYQTVNGAKNQNIPVSVCGEMAGDPAAALLLVGMGLNSLSMSIVALPRIKSLIRKFSYIQAKQILKECLALDDSKMIRRLLNQHIDNAGLGGLLRPGK